MPSSPVALLEFIALISFITKSAETGSRSKVAPWSFVVLISVESPTGMSAQILTIEETK